MTLQLKTNKLFYGKWPFKVECYLKGSNKITRNGHNETIEWCLRDSASKIHYHIEKDIDRGELYKFAIKVNKYSKKDVQFRTEGNTFNIYFKDQDLLKDIQQELYQWIKVVSAPESAREYQYLLEAGRSTVLCNALPYKKYQYKIIFSTKMTADQRINFLRWTENYGDKMHIAGHSLRWSLGKKPWMQDPFMYLEDNKLLSMVLLYLGSNCNRIQEFVLKSSINTPCPH